jgi:hypothetical protein
MLQVGKAVRIDIGLLEHFIDFFLHDAQCEPESTIFQKQRRNKGIFFPNEKKKELILDI